MAKKRATKAASKKKKVTRKKVAAKKVTKKKPTKKKVPPTKAKVAKKSPARKKTLRKTTAKKKAATQKKAAPQPPVVLGRPKLRGDADLDLAFKDDFQARQIFKFLRVNTVNELQRYSPKQIRKVLIEPLAHTIERIRRMLAENNRCLADDEEYLRALKAGSQ